MVVVIQRVSSASVDVDGTTIGKIGRGQVILLGIEDADDETDIEWLTRKVSQLRIFDDKNGVMNESALEVGGEFLVISQFTLHASTRKGNRPSYIKAAKPEVSIPLYERFVEKLRVVTPGKVETGEFGADMKVSLVNDGPVTIVIDSKDRK